MGLEIGSICRLSGWGAPSFFDDVERSGAFLAYACGSADAEQFLALILVVDVLSLALLTMEGVEEQGRRAADWGVVGRV